MKKNRMIAWTLATSMMVSSLSTSSFAQDFGSSVEPAAESIVEADVNENAEVTDEEVDVLADEVVSGGAADLSGAEIVPMASDDFSTGYYKNKNFTITLPDDNGVASMTTTTNTAGKYTDSEYNVGYLARNKVTADTDFVFSGTVTVNSFTANSNHHQKAFGMMLANSLEYEKESTFKHVSAYLTGKASSDSVNNVLNIAMDSDGKREVLKTLATDLEVRSGDTFDFKMRKAGNAIEITVNGKTSSVIVDDGYFDGEIYPMFFIARSANIEVSNISYEEKAAVKSIEITKMPSKTEYYTSQALNTEGLEVTATLADGSKKVLDESDYILSGFDSSKLGTSTVTVSAGKGTATFDTKIRNIEVSKIEITQKPYKDEFFYGTKFKTDGLVANVTLEDGSVESFKHNTKEADDSLSLIYFIGGKEYKAGDILPKSLQGTQTVKVFRKDTESVTGGDVYGEYTIEVSQANLSRIEVYRNPNTTTYYYGNEFDPTGLIVAAYYEDENGGENYDFLTESEYTITGYNSTSTSYGKQTLTITSTFDPSKTTTLDVDYIESREMAMDIAKYPRLTFDVGEDFDKEGLEVKVSMNDGKSKIVAEGEYYEIDLSEYDNTKAGTTKVVIKSLKDNLQSIPLDVTIQEAETHPWRATIFGQSASGAGVGAGPSTVTITPSENYGTVDEGTIVNTKSWNGAGKIATDQDGMAYYYTRVSTDKNVTLSADMEIVGYMSAYYEDKYDIYGNFIPDKDRSGQEAVGLMLRDVIPLKAESGYGDDNGITIYPGQAVVDDEGEPVPYNVVAENPATDPTFASNMAQAAAMAPDSFPSDPTSSSYAKKITTNRISLIMRTGVTSYVSAGANAKKSQYATLTDSVPKAGDKYRITLQRANGGVRLECTDYQTGKTTDYYQDVDDLVTLQDPENMYIGFFAARWGEANFSNIDFHVTDPATDPVYPVPAKSLISPSVSVQSSKNTTEQNYNLMLKPNHDSGGYVMIKLNDKIVYNNALLSRKGTTYPVELVPDSVNNFTVIYTPNAADDITSTKDVVTSFTVTHKSNYDSSAKFLYAGPEGTPAGSGTKDDPMDVYSAIGFIEPGQTIYLLEGTYDLPEPIDIPITNFGYQTAGKGKAMIADPEATSRPFFNFENATGDEGMKVTGNYWTLKGFDITAPAPNMKGFSLGGSHCLVEDVKTIGCGTTGFQISRTYTTNDFSLWPSYNTVKNCESYNSADPARQNADGFGCKLTVGVGNVFDGCVSHHNSDDGWDLYTKLGTGAIGPVKLQNCISYKQGYQLVDGKSSEYGTFTGHNGYKMGGENISVKHYIKDSISFLNLATGVDSNSNPAIKIRNLVCFNNPTNFNLMSAAATRVYDYDLKGAVSYKTADYIESKGYYEELENDGAAHGRTDSIGTFNKDTDFKNTAPQEVANETNFLISDSKTGSVNPITGEVVTDDFFVSVNPDDMLTDGLIAQDSEGNFIRNGFLVLTNPILSPEDYDEEAEETTEGTTATEATTRSNNGGGSGGGGGSSSGGSSSSSNKGGKATAKASNVNEENKVHTHNSDVPGSSETSNKSADATFKAANGTIIAPPVTTTTPLSFSDLTGRDWAKSSIDKLSSLGVISGVAIGKFDPDASSKRADFVIMLDKVLGISGYASDNFSDVESNKYYANYVGLAKETGLATGYTDGTFKPDNTISRQDMMVLVAKSLELCGEDISANEASLDQFSDSDKIGDYAKPYVAYLVSKGIVSGTGNNIEPTKDMTRAQMSVIMSKLYDEILSIAQNYAAEQAAAAQAQAAEETSVEESTEASSEETTSEETTSEETTSEETTSEETTSEETTSEETTEA